MVKSKLKTKEEKPFNLEITRSKGEAVYIKGLRVWKNKKDDSIRISDNEKAIYCPKGTAIERFFRRYFEK